MQADIKRRIARLKEPARRPEEEGQADPYRVEREGAGRIFVVGPPTRANRPSGGAYQREGSSSVLPLRDCSACSGHDEV